jgi:fumarate reductase subunit C
MSTPREQSSSYTEFHPQWYRPRTSTYWWLRKRSYLLFILRELSSVFVAWAVGFLVFLVAAMSNGPRSYRDFLDWADTPWVIGLNIVTLVFLVYHAVTWFNLTPKAVVVKARGQRLPDWAVALPPYVGWVVVSAFIAWLVLGA